MSSNKFGLREENWEVLRLLAIDPLKKADAKVWVFGSRARGDSQKFSDLDLLYEFRESAPIALIGTIEESLENSNLPIKVDLVNRRDLAESYRDQIEKEKVEL
ncbi:nucleotidyltransferase domain-containing protein [bacterium]|nr:nucleotidyltransferase domain-containing protein [bacterium]